MSIQVPGEVDTETLPIIDIGPMRDRSPEGRAKVGNALRRACRDTGFFYIRNHGVCPELIERVFKASRAFFDQDMEAKMAVDRHKVGTNRGYEPLRAQTLEPGTPPDLKESFMIGEDMAANDPRILQGRFNMGPNQWPSHPPEFQPVMTEYFAAMVALGEHIMRGLALSLDLPEDYFEEFGREPVVNLRLLHYPEQPGNAQPDEKGCGAHTDFGGVTILLLDDNPGLQVWDAANRRWIDANPIPGTFVVNLGDMIARWTNNRYRSTVHRVINRSGARRYSVPFFYNGNLDHEVRCLPSCLGPGEEPRFPPTTVEQHLIDMYRRTYG